MNIEEIKNISGGEAWKTLISEDLSPLSEKDLDLIATKIGEELENISRAITNSAFGAEPKSAKMKRIEGLISLLHKVREVEGSVMYERELREIKKQREAIRERLAAKK